MHPRRKLCNLCGLNIWLVPTAQGKLLPLDPEPTPDGRLVLDMSGVVHPIPRDVDVHPDRPRYTTHFATCDPRRRREVGSLV